MCEMQNKSNDKQRNNIKRPFQGKIKNREKRKESRGKFEDRQIARNRKTSDWKNAKKLLYFSLPNYQHRSTLLSTFYTEPKTTVRFKCERECVCVRARVSSHRIHIHVNHPASLIH